MRLRRRCSEITCQSAAWEAFLTEGVLATLAGRCSATSEELSSAVEARMQRGKLSLCSHVLAVRGRLQADALQAHRALTPFLTLKLDLCLPSLHRGGA